MSPIVFMPFILGETAALAEYPFSFAPFKATLMAWTHAAC